MTAFRKLASMLQGTIVLPSSPAYDAAHRLWNARFDDVRPAAIVEVAGAGDVGTVVKFAREHDLRLTPRNGRHSFTGHSTGEGLIVVDLSRLTGVEVDAEAATARVGAGATLLPLYQALWPHRAAIPGGTCPTVGIAGLTGVGGLGVLGRLHGLTCDSLAAADVVGPDGQLIQADEEQNPDLFWALRGAGDGHFGIIVSLTFRLVPVDVPFTHASFELPWSTAVRALGSWQEWAHAAPPGLWSALELQTQAPAADEAPQVLIETVFGGAPEELERITAELFAAAGAEPIANQSSTSDFVTIPADFYCKGLRPDECRIEGLSAAGRIPRSSYYGKSDVATGPWPSAGFEVLVERIEERQRDPLLTPADFSAGHDVGKVLIEISDGAVGSVPADATAFVHRDALFVSQYAARWRAGAPEETAAANIEWANGLYAAVEPCRSGSSYQGYADPELAGWEQAYYGANVPRLRRIKSAYDPDGFFGLVRNSPVRLAPSSALRPGFD